MHTNPRVVSLILIAVSLSAAAGDWRPRDQAIWNLASGYAFMTQCATQGHIPLELVSRLGSFYQSRMTENAYVKFRDTYQRTLHEMRLYSIAYDRWIPYQLDAEACEGMDKGVQLYILRLSEGQTDTPPE